MPAALDYVTWDGKLWAIPYRIETHAVIFNKGDFTAAGLDPASAAADLGRAGRRRRPKLTKDGKSGFAITGGGEVGNTIFRSLPFIWMNGGSIISDDVQDGDGQRAGGGRGGDLLHRLLQERPVAGLDAGERRHRQPPALHRRDGVDVPVRPVRRRLDPQGEPGHRHRRDADPASRGQGDRGDPRRLELRRSRRRARTPTRRRRS